jgi:hypothetical protein
MESLHKVICRMRSDVSTEASRGRPWGAVGGRGGRGPWGPWAVGVACIIAMNRIQERM